MSKYRTNTADAPQPIKTKPKEAPGTIPANKVGVYDAKRRLRAQVGRLATSATVARFVGHGAKLGKVAGRDAWIGPTLADVSAAGVAATPDNPGDTLADVSSRGATATQIKSGGTS
jgi:hypothetical protein